MYNWRTTTIGEETDLLTGFPFKSAQYVNTSDGIRLVRGDNVVQGRFRWDDVKRWSAAEIVPYERYFLCEDDIVLAMDRPWIEAGLKFACVTKLDLPCLLVQRVARLRAKHSLDQRYLRYIIGSKEFTNHVLGVQTGSAVPHISASQIKEFSFACPPVEEQRAIAAVLGALDDKIELNRRMNATLETMARALFQSWFVDFDPVRAKMEGRAPYGMDAATAALFPAAFTDSSLGPIPAGWQTGILGEAIAIGRASINPGGYPEETFDHYSIPAYDDGMMPKPELGEQIMSNKFVVIPDAVLLSKLNPRIPRVWIPATDTSRRSICSTEFLVAKARDRFSREFMYALFTSRPFLDVFASLVTGTSSSHQRVKPEYLLTMTTILPPRGVVAAFSEATAPLFERIARSRKESQTLAAIRDVLLPKLLSGAVRVRDVVRAMGAAI